MWAHWVIAIRTSDYLADVRAVVEFSEDQISRLSTASLVTSAEKATAGAIDTPSSTAARSGRTANPTPRSNRACPQKQPEEVQRLQTEPTLVGAMYDMVPHTRPLLVSGSGSNAGNGAKNGEDIAAEGAELADMAVPAVDGPAGGSRAQHRSDRPPAEETTSGRIIII